MDLEGWRSLAAERAGFSAHRKHRRSPRLLTDRRLLNRCQANPQFQRPGRPVWYPEPSLTSPKIPRAKALVRFSRYGAAQEAALKENWI